jgi:polyisoprenoid-binding protein YceI
MPQEELDNMTATSTRTTTWAIDAAHSIAEFSVKHMMISTVKGSFQNVQGEVSWDGENFSTATVDARIDSATLTTNNEMRDNHLRTNDFFNAEKWPAITFTSTQVEHEGDDEFKLHGELTIRDVTKPVVLDVEFEGLMEKDAFGNRRAAFTGTTSINRKEFGINWNGAIEGGGVVVGDKVKVTLHIAVTQEA